MISPPVDANGFFQKRLRPFISGAACCSVAARRRDDELLLTPLCLEKNKGKYLQQTQKHWDIMVIQWDYNGDTTVIQWDYNGDKTVIYDNYDRSQVETLTAPRR